MKGFKLMDKELCLCHSGKGYEECCASFHRREANPETPLDLMRSRYSAYAKKIPAYIISTTHVTNPQYQEDLLEWSRSILEAYAHTEFVGLKIFKHYEKGNKGYVSFEAKLVNNGKDASFSEESEFIKEQGRWYYLKGIAKK
ncbi:MAG: hypothetical protein S4CHLAM7_07750 [Chlamydiae bacterium]|nr:hypothetical protein [Chlamydiota bacterium]